MKKTIITTAAFLITFLFSHFAFSEEADQTDATTYECVTIDEFDNNTTPEEMYFALWGCIDNQDFNNAAKIFAFSAAYTAYDSKRIIDKQSHQLYEQDKATKYQITEENRNELMKEVELLLKPKSESLAEMCATIKEKGMPNYHPDYLLQFSREESFELDDDGLVDDFDAENTWEQVLSSFLKCEG